MYLEDYIGFRYVDVELKMVSFFRLPLHNIMIGRLRETKFRLVKVGTSTVTIFAKSVQT